MVQLLLIPHVLLVLLLMAVPVALAVGGLLIFRRLAPNESLEANAPAIGGTFGLVSFLFAIIVGSLVTLGWTRYNEAQLRANQEATYLGDLLRSAEGFEEPARRELQTLLIRYAQEVVDNEWSTMVQGHPITLGVPAYEALWDYMTTFQPTTDHARTFYGLALGDLQSLGEQRRLRVLTTQTEPSSLLWVMLFAGGSLAIFFTYLFPAKNPRFKVLKVALLAAMLGLVFYLLVSLQYPYVGELTPSPRGFQDLLELWEPKLGL